MNKATQARDAALIAVEASNQGQIQKALEYVKFCAQRMPELTTDIFECPEWPFTDGRALGPVMVKAARLGYITKTNRIENSSQARCHARGKMVWKSNIYTK